MTVPAPTNTNVPDRRHLHEADLRLVRDALRNNSLAREQLRKRLECIPSILAARNRLMGRPIADHDLPDIAQDVLVIVLRKLPSLEGRSTLETWIYRICTLELMNAIRRVNRTWNENDSPDTTSQASHTSARLDPGQRAIYIDLYSGLEEIDALDARIIRMKTFEDYTFTEIGRQLDLTTSKSKARYYRGLRALEQRLRPGWEDGLQ